MVATDENVVDDSGLARLPRYGGVGEATTQMSLLRLILKQIETASIPSPSEHSSFECGANLVGDSSDGTTSEILYIIYRDATGFAIPGLDTEAPSPPNNAIGAIDSEIGQYDAAIDALSALVQELKALAEDGRGFTVSQLLRRQLIATELAAGSTPSNELVYGSFSDPFAHLGPTAWRPDGNDVLALSDQLVGLLSSDREILAEARRSTVGSSSGKLKGRPENLMLRAWVSQMGEIWSRFAGRPPTYTRPTGINPDVANTSGEFSEFVRLIVRTRAGGEEFLRENGNLAGEIRAVCASFTQQGRNSVQNL